MPADKPLLVYSTPVTPPRRVWVQNRTELGGARPALLLAENTLGGIVQSCSVRYTDMLTTMEALVPPGAITGRADSVVIQFRSGRGHAGIVRDAP